MGLADIVTSRRSEQHLADPAPGDAAVLELLGAAAASADHGQLRRWRIIAYRGASRQLLGAALAASVAPERQAEAAAKAFRAPLILTLVLTPRMIDRIPWWEQLAAAAGVAHTLMLLLHDAGFGSIWRTGRLVDCRMACALLGIADDEQLLGWLYVGTPVRVKPKRARAPFDPAKHWSTPPVAAIPTQ